MAVIKLLRFLNKLNELLQQSFSNLYFNSDWSDMMQMLMLTPQIIHCRFSVNGPLSYEHTERQASSVKVSIRIWEWVWDPFWSVTMHFNGPWRCRCHWRYRCRSVCSCPKVASLNTSLDMYFAVEANNCYDEPIFKWSKYSFLKRVKLNRSFCFKCNT